MHVECWAVQCATYLLDIDILARVTMKNNSKIAYCLLFNSYIKGHYIDKP